MPKTRLPRDGARILKRRGVVIIRQGWSAVSPHSTSVDRWLPNGGSDTVPPSFLFRGALMRIRAVRSHDQDVSIWFVQREDLTTGTVRTPNSQNGSEVKPKLCRARPRIYACVCKSLAVQQAKTLAFFGPPKLIE